MGGPRRAPATGIPSMGAVSEPRGGRCGVVGHRCFHPSLPGGAAAERCSLRAGAALGPHAGSMGSPGSSSEESVQGREQPFVVTEVLGRVNRAALQFLPDEDGGDSRVSRVFTPGASGAIRRWVASTCPNVSASGARERPLSTLVSLAQPKKSRLPRLDKRRIWDLLWA
jgi:hypothetical protein